MIVTIRKLCVAIWSGLALVACAQAQCLAGQICPVQHQMDWNSVHYHYCLSNLNCTGNPQQGVSNHDHKLGCMNGKWIEPIGTGSQAQPNVQYFLPNIKLQGRVKPRKPGGDPGESNDQGSTVDIAGLGTSVEDEWVIKVQ